MADRLSLQRTLEEIMGENKVYFDPPTNMEYPCIKYSLIRPRYAFANGKHYLKDTQYKITLIDEDSESVFCSFIEDLPYCAFETHYVSEGLHHYVYTITI